MLAVFEAERYQHVRDCPAVPVRHDHVDRRELVEIVAAGFPALRVIGAAAPFEIAHIVQRHSVALDAAMGDLRDIVRPEALVGGGDAPPPDEQNRECESKTRAGRARMASPERNQYAQREGAPQSYGDALEPTPRGLIPERQRGPDRRATQQKGGGQHGGKSHNTCGVEAQHRTHCASNVRLPVHRSIDMHRRRKVRFLVTQPDCISAQCPLHQRTRCRVHQRRRRPFDGGAYSRALASQ